MPETIASIIDRLPAEQMLPVRTLSFMTGSKVAHRVEGVLLISPAMWKLMRSDDTAEVRRLFEAIQVLDFEVPAEVLRRPSEPIIVYNPFAFMPAVLPPCPTEES